MSHDDMTQPQNLWPSYYRGHSHFTRITGKHMTQPQSLWPNYDPTHDPTPMTQPQMVAGPCVVRVQKKEY